MIELEPAQLELNQISFNLTKKYYNSMEQLIGEGSWPLKNKFLNSSDLYTNLQEIYLFLSPKGRNYSSTQAHVSCRT